MKERANEGARAGEFERKLWKALETTGEERQRKVLRLRHQVEEGSYRVPVEELARKLLKAGLMEFLDRGD